jgi:glycogen(starch) synthase
MAERGEEVHVFTSETGQFNGTRYPPNMKLHVLRTYGMVWGMNPIADVFSRLVKEDFDVVHVHSYIFYMSNLAAMAKVLKGFPYILHFHGGVYRSTASNSCRTKFWIKDNIYDNTLGKMTVKLADRVFSVSKRDIPIIREKFGVEAEFVPNAVNTDQFDPSGSDSRMVTYVGKLEKWKGMDELLEIFRIVHDEVDDAQFMVVGSGSLMNKVRKTDLPIKIMGHVPHEQMPQLYGRSAVTALPSLMEGSPTTCIESLACGVPCVASDVGDVREIIKDGRSGYVVEPGDVESSAERIVNLLTNESLRKRMGAEGRQHVIKEFSYDAVVDRTREIYASLVDQSEDVAMASPEGSDAPRRAKRSGTRLGSLWPSRKGGV